jgi:hypothetical protein
MVQPAAERPSECLNHAASASHCRRRRSCEDVVKSFDQVAREGVQLFQIRYPVQKVGASLFMNLSGESLALREIPTSGGAGRRFWIKIKHANGVESMSMEVVNGRVVRNLAAPDGTMAHRH